MCLSGLRGLICLGDESIFLLHYKREEVNALLAFSLSIYILYNCVYVGVLPNCWHTAHSLPGIQTRVVALAQQGHVICSGTDWS